MDKRDLIQFIDLTRLENDDEDQKIITLCHKANTGHGAVAAVCIYPEYIALAKQHLHAPIKIATVANFPSGSDSFDSVSASILESIEQGANEIDVVMPYQDYIAGKQQAAIEFIKQCERLLPNQIKLKVILESGAFDDEQTLYQASIDMINAGADFLKTSTGKISKGASLDAAAIMLSAINDSKAAVGFKASGGVRTEEQAMQYYCLAQNIMGATWPTQDTFRIGASSLLDDLLA